MKRKIRNLFRNRRAVVLGAVLSLLLVAVMAMPSALATAPAPPLLNGTYTVSPVAAKYLSGSTHPVIGTSTLTLSNTGPVEAVTGTLTDIGASITLTGFVGSGTKPYIALKGTDSVGTTVTITGRVTVKDGVATAISGNINGFITSEGEHLVYSGDGSSAFYTGANVHSGAYSALLTAGTTGGASFELQHMLNSITLKQLSTLTGSVAKPGKLGFWYLLSAAPGPQIGLRFTAPTCTSTDQFPGGVTGAGHVDVNIMPAQGVNAVTGAWTYVPLNKDSTRCMFYGNAPDALSSAFSGDPWGQGTTAVLSLKQVLSLINACPEMTAGGYKADSWKLTMVTVLLWESGSRTCYIDDITVGSYTFTLEPTLVNGTFKATKVVTP